MLDGGGGSEMVMERRQWVCGCKVKTEQDAGAGVSTERAVAKSAVQDAKRRL